MAVHQIETMDGYVKYLQQTPAEVEALFRDLLIGVTSFFRDPEAFKALEEQVIPKLFAGKPAGAVIRVWSPGCSTGEEAYSIAILLQERMEALKQSFKVQVFATDIDSRAIATARAGLYPASIAADISPERLARFFTAEPDGSAYRIHKRHPRHAGLFRAGRDQRPALLQTRPDQLPQPPDLYGRGLAEEAHPPVPLRAEPGRFSLPGHLGDRGRVWRSFCRAGPQIEAVSAQGGFSQRARAWPWAGFCRP